MKSYIGDLNFYINQIDFFDLGKFVGNSTVQARPGKIASRDILRYLHSANRTSFLNKSFSTTMAASRTMLALLVVGSIIIVASGQKGKGTEKEYLGGTVYGGRSQQALLVEWVKSLKPELDYMGTRHWKQMCHSNSAEHYFNEYNERFSKIAERLGASVNFISIGACDGTNDDTIKDRFLAHSHWNGVFVEPMSNNFADLTNFLAINEVANRSTAIRGAATATCTSPFLEVQRPLTEEKDPNSAHWLRRQIGSILPDGQKTKQGWTTEKVQKHIFLR